jgi:hypothetical protein
LYTETPRPNTNRHVRKIQAHNAGIEPATLA